MGVTGVGNPRLNATLDLPAAHAALPPAVAQTPQAVAKAPCVRFRQAPIAARVEDKAEKSRRLSRLLRAGLVWMKPQPPALQKHGDATPPRFELPGVIVKQGEVVHVAHVTLGPQYFLAEMVQAVEVQVGKELAGQIADRQAAPSFQGGKQIIARIVEKDGFLRVGRVDDAVRQRQGAAAGNTAAQVALE